MDEINNTVELCGTAAGAPVFSHGGRGENFYTFPLEVLRLSGTGDTVNVVVRERLLDQMPVDSAGRIALRGELRSFNNRSGRGSRQQLALRGFPVCGLRGGRLYAPRNRQG